MTLRPTLIARLQRVSNDSFAINVGLDDLTCFFKISNLECLQQRCTDNALAEILAERIVSARYPDYDVFVKYEGEEHERR